MYNNNNNDIDNNYSNNNTNFGNVLKYNCRPCL